MTETRIYIVNVANHGRHLVRATSKAAALAHVTRAIATVGLATQDMLVQCLTDGIKVETAGASTADDIAD